jgi:hypothetical protein
MKNRVFRDSRIYKSYLYTIINILIKITVT